MNLISRDEYYKKTMGVVDRSCPFCVDEQITLSTGKYWYWLAANAPYMRYQTMLVPKRHIIKMSEVSEAEYSEFSQLLEQIMHIYTSSNLKWSDTGEKVENMFFGWRYRGKIMNDVLKTKNIDHLHMHIFPDREHHLDPLIQKDGHEWDVNIFKDKIKIKI